MNELKNLLPETATVLQKISEAAFIENFTFVGGSALAIHLGHRLSEDIDLFTWHNTINPLEIHSELEKLGFESIRTNNLTAVQADFVIDGVKVTFFVSGWQELQNRTKLLNHLYIAELETIAVMKVNTLFLRAKFRDYYDLYVLNITGLSVKKLFELTSIKMKNLSMALFQKALVFTDDISDDVITHLKPRYKMSISEIEKHFRKEIKNWNKGQ
jgi:predicted nucleotidyltransferase component of viral defense system